jgi:hypothetical protein
MGLGRAHLGGWTIRSRGRLHPICCARVIRSRRYRVGDGCHLGAALIEGSVLSLALCQHATTVPASRQSLSAMQYQRLSNDLSQDSLRLSSTTELQETRL